LEGSTFTHKIYSKFPIKSYDGQNIIFFLFKIRSKKKDILSCRKNEVEYPKL